MSFQTMDIEPINASQQSLVRIFSDEFAFTIPPYQRPYAWGEEQVRELLADISSALDEALFTKDPVTYFLGSIVLIKKPGSPNADVVDGQQRLTTLTILLAVLRDLSNGKTAAKRHAYICEEGDTDKGTKDRYRLAPRRQDADFFKMNVQEEGTTAKLSGEEGGSESQCLMAANAFFFRNSLKKWDAKRRDDLFAFLVQRCYLVVISVSSVDTAHRVFTVLNARGLDLTATDILKADLLDRVATENEEKFALDWEAFESALGRERFVELFQHIRMIYQKEKPRERLELGFAKHVTIFKVDADKFMNAVLRRFAETYEVLLNPSDVEDKFGSASRRLVASLLRLDNSDWLPVALDYLSKDKLKKEQANGFLAALERLAYYMFVSRYDINARIARYSNAIAELQKGVDPSSPKCSLSLKKEEQYDFLDELDGPIYEKARVRLPVLLRLDDAFSDGAAEYTHKIISVEHVMPQNPKADSPWLSMFEDESERYGWTHCLGNLVLLTRAKNSQANNWDFDRKKSEYFSTKAGVSSFKLTTMVIKEKVWDVVTLEKRHLAALEKLADVWNLDFDSWSEFE
jgi:Protein of unknown function DUF262/Protein of unknown function (DUF1524)